MLPNLPDFQLLFDALPTPYLALSFHDLTVVAANAASQAAVGPEVPLIGRVAPELFGATEAAWRAALESTGTGSPLPVYLSRPESQAGAYAVCCWYLTLTPVRLATGEIHYWLCQLQEQSAMRMEVKAATSTELDSEQFRFLAEFIPQLVWITDAKGRYYYFNARWTAYTGHTLADADVPGLWQAMTHPDDQQRVRQQWRHCLSTGQAYEIEHRFRARNGSFRWFLSQALPQRDAAGNIVRWFGTSTDIDDQKCTRQLLEEKDQQLQQILSQVPAHIATLTGPNHVYRYVNERAQQLFRGQARVGLPAAVAAPELVEQGFITLIDDVYRTGQPFVLHEMPFHSADQVAGREEWFFNGVFQPLVDEHNQTQGILVFGVDVTEQVQAKRRAAELLEKVRYQDREFQQALESLPQMAWVSRPDGGVLYYNQRWYDFTGGTFENMREQGWENFIHPDDLPTTQLKWNTALRAGTTFEAEHRWRSQTGDYRWFLARAEPIRREDGRIVRWVGSNTDIEDKRLAQARLEEKDRQLLQILSRAPASIVTLEGPEHRLTFFNDSYSILVGGRTELGLPLAELLPEIEEQGFIALLDNVYRTGEPWMAFETLVALKQPGTDAFRQHYVTFSYQPLHDEQHHVRGVLGFILDITEQVRSRQQSEALQAHIRRRDEQVRLMTESLPVMTFICNPTGHIVYAGPQWYAFTGADPLTDDINDIWPDVLHPDDLLAIRQEYKIALQESRGWSYEFRLRRHDGNYRWILSRGVPEFDATGRVLCWYCTNTEVHEERELREQLQAQNAELLRTNESLDNFVYTTSHDLRQPINNMAGIFQELVRTASFPDPDAVKLVAMFERALTQINDTIHDLSELIQVQKQRQYLPTEAIDLAAFTAEILASIQDQLTASGAEVTTNFEAVPVIQFVRPSLQSVLYNLLSNALKYAAPNRQANIQLSSYLHEDDVVLVVEDNGIGIDMARFGSQLFQLFRRFHDHVDGSGVGLYLVNRIVQSHGGRVEVESTVNKGTTFRVYLPLQH